MPHFKCVGCKTRLYSAAAVGFQSMPLETERWPDDGGSASHEAAEAIALTAPGEYP